MTISLHARTGHEPRFGKETAWPRSVPVNPAIAPLDIDAAEYWRGSSIDHVKATFRRITSELNTSDDGRMAAEHFTGFAEHATGVDAVCTATLLGQVACSIPHPIGTALIVSAPSCSPVTVIENVAASLAARNCVELALFERPDPLLSALIDALQWVLPEGLFTVLSEQTGWGSRGPDTAIVIITPEHAFMNERPWVRSGAGTTGNALVAFYSRWESLSAVV
ncbi:hypothetical protein BH09ACT6_BH09ACT6_14970 [soil metagenome]